MSDNPPLAEPDSRQSLHAGGYAQWLQQTRRVLWLRNESAEVPCGSCTACCRASMFVHIAPDESATLAHIPKSLLFPAPGAPEGHVLMGYNERGECPMFKDDKCSIYEHRPRTCRAFDCRVFAATGVEPQDPAQSSIAAQVRRWKFDRGGDEDKRARAAVEAAATFLRDHGEELPPAIAPRNASQLAALAIKVHGAFTGAGDPARAGGPVDAVVAAVLAAVQGDHETPF